jgi:hypothetical protein
MTWRARALSALGAYLCLGAQLLGVVHVLVVRHATCPEHGEVTHGVPAAASPPDEVLVVTVRRAGPTVEDLDEHCLLVIARRRDLAGPSPLLAAALEPLPPATVPPAAGASSLLPSVGVLRLAPKTSPPLV